FDFDGTLADSKEWMIGVLNHLAVRHRFRQVDRAQIEALRGQPTREVMRDLGVSPWRLPFIAADMRKRSAADAGRIHACSTLITQLAGQERPYRATDQRVVRVIDYVMQHLHEPIT